MHVHAFLTWLPLLCLSCLVPVVACLLLRFLHLASPVQLALPALHGRLLLLLRMRVPV